MEDKKRISKLVETLEKIEKGEVVFAFPFILESLMEERDISQMDICRATNGIIKKSTLSGWLPSAKGVPKDRPWADPKSVLQIRLVADFFDKTIDEICFGGSERDSRRALEYAERLEQKLALEKAMADAQLDLFLSKEKEIEKLKKENERLSKMISTKSSDKPESNQEINNSMG